MQFVVTIFLFAFAPILDFLIEWIELTCHRKFHLAYTDNGHRMYSWRVVYQSQVNKKDKNDFLKYLDLYAGPEYSFHSKLAATNLLVFTVIIFGPILPLLYPAAMVGLVI
jgi:hypothetical protein